MINIRHRNTCSFFNEFWIFWQSSVSLMLSFQVLFFMYQLFFQYFLIFFHKKSAQFLGRLLLSISFLLYIIQNYD